MIKEYMKEEELMFKKRHVQRKRSNDKQNVVRGVILVTIAFIIAVLVYIFLQDKPIPEIVDPIDISKSIVPSSESKELSSDSSFSASSELSSSDSKLAKPVFNTLYVQTAFDTFFGSQQGEHTLFFQEITNGQGDVVSSDPLLINDQPIRSASTIKLFILGALYEQVEKGKLSLETEHILQEQEIVGGTGVIQNAPTGTRYTLQELAHAMIVTSDNTATNILIDYIGQDTINQFIKSKGYKDTILNRKMLDYASIQAGKDNYTSAKEVGDFMTRLFTRQLVSTNADSQMLHILSQQQDHTNLEAKLPSDVRIYNKSGQMSDYGVRNDVAIVTTSKGTYVLAVLSQEGQESEQTSAMQFIGDAVYQAFTQQRSQ